MAFYRKSLPILVPYHGCQHILYYEVKAKNNIRHVAIHIVPRLHLTWVWHTQTYFGSPSKHFRDAVALLMNTFYGGKYNELTIHSSFLKLRVVLNVKNIYLASVSPMLQLKNLF